MAAYMWQKVSFAIWQTLLISLVWTMTQCKEEMSITFPDDIITPYVEQGYHGSPHSHRHTRDCQNAKYGNVTHQSQPSYNHPNNSIAKVTLPIVTVKRFFDDFSNRVSPGHIAYINNPLRTFSVLEPFEVGGCDSKRRATVEESAEQRKCLVATNAGYFNTHTGECYGNIVSDGRLVANSNGIQNAHFGIRKNGTLVFGYLTEEDVLDTENPFVQLIGGVGWILRDGEVYLEESMKAECSDTEETGSINKFFSVISARTALASDREGRLMIAQVDGQTTVRGVTLDEFAQFLLKHGAVNAINLDGGGSATFVINGTVANYPSDHCSDPAFRCARQVSTVVCVHEADCSPPDCNSHGQCVLGECQCRGNWRGPGCEVLQCGARNCSHHGICTEDGCKCFAGYQFPYCSQLCGPGTYGNGCHSECLCEHGGDCDPLTGDCTCMPGYTGQYCDEICPYGFYGPGCREQCNCGDTSCACHHITGLCNISYMYNDTAYANLLQAGQCLANSVISEQHLVPYISLWENPYVIACIILLTVLITSLMCNIALLCFRCTCKCSTRPMNCNSPMRSNKVAYHPVNLFQAFEDEDSSSL
ncbi:N-acetylglucosamine-1-phosphodiester alpha-N-acetylglucosaminidase-like [Amphiura filiformis]|uniref:N-acetylglucosamine-1-phosphodiester alpha-N-acetylglucosaminidase-like n=1 Tax=Amphiura filiformis TaxID=82378 RepID=UPI003B212693